MLVARQLIERLMLDKLFSVPAPLSGLEKTVKFLCALSVAFLVMGLLLLLYGTYRWLSIHYGEEIAIMITGVISIVISVLIAATLYAVICYHKARLMKLQKKVTDKIKSSLSTLEHELGEPIQENPKMALIIALFLGFLVEDQFLNNK